MREPHPPGAPPNFVARTRTDGRKEGRKDGRGIKRLSNVSHITESRECHPEGSRHSNGSRGGRGRSEPGSGESPGVSLASPSPAARPGVPWERIFGEPVFPGVQILDRGHWVPQRLPEAGRRHHARATPRCFGRERVAFTIGRHLCWWRLTLRPSLKRRTPLLHNFDLRRYGSPTIRDAFSGI